MNDPTTPAPKPPRPKPGERRLQILQTLAAMLQEPGGDRVTTAALAGRRQVSEAALYRHFASKAQMFEGLIEFIESSVFTLVNQITEREPGGALQTQRIGVRLRQFGEQNPGMRAVRERFAPAWASWELKVIVSVAADSPEALAELLADLDMVEGVAGVELPLAAHGALRPAEAAPQIGRASCRERV